METSEIFDTLLRNLKVGDASTTISSRRDEITKALNKDFRSSASSTGNRLMIGSYGRHTAIRGISDLDLIYILPSSMLETYDDASGPRRVLNRVRDALRARYPSTDIRVDQCVVRVQFTSNRFKFEVQPAFENADGSFSYPDTIAEKWKETKPREEIAATRSCNDRTSSNMRQLARMTRAWKNKSGVAMGGLLIDTLVYRFFESTSDYDMVGTDSYGLMARDFFEFLKDEPNQNYYLALGSKQHVKVKARFQGNASKAHKRCLEAISNEGKASANQTWREVFGNSVPLASTTAERAFDNTEEFIEDKFAVDITYEVAIDCEVSQPGWRPALLSAMLRDRTWLSPNKDLRFKVTTCDVPHPYSVRWKVLNRGDEAERRDNIRGQIINSSEVDVRKEKTRFRGEHVVECYVIKDDVVVARERIDVPIAI